MTAESYFRTYFLLLGETTESLRLLPSLVTKYQLQGRIIHDANIVATMLANGVSTLLTHNVSDFNRFADTGIQVMGLEA